MEYIIQNWFLRFCRKICAPLNPVPDDEEEDEDDEGGPSVEQN